MTKLLEQAEDGDAKWEKLFADPRSEKALEQLWEQAKNDEIEDVEVSLERCRAERKLRIQARRAAKP
jgi:hypothetical protein